MDPADRDWSHLPHVTDILAEAGLIDTTWFTAEACEKGSAVHLAAQFLDEDDLDFDALDPAVAPRVAQYAKFLAEMKPMIHRIEMRVENKVHGYCGTLDRLVEMDIPRRGLQRGVLDLKGLTASPSHGPQLAAYQDCVGRKEWPCRWNLYLMPDRYKLVEHRDRDDWPVFFAALTISNWRKKNGIN